MTLYLIRAGKEGPVKIGHGKHPRRRPSNLQSGNFAKLELLGLADGGEVEERRLHARFRHLKLGK